MPDVTIEIISCGPLRRRRSGRVGYPVWVLPSGRRLPRQWTARFRDEARNIEAIAEVVRRSGGLACLSLEVRATDGRPLTAARLRFPLQRWIEASIEEVPTGESQDDKISVLNEYREVGPPGRVELTDEFLEQVADVYRESDPRAPAKGVAEHFGVGRSTARSWIQKARSRGKLPSTRARQKTAGSQHQADRGPNAWDNSEG